jgi:hypothetical protein
MYNFDRYFPWSESDGIRNSRSASDRLFARDLAVGCGIERREIRLPRLTNRSCQSACQPAPASGCGSILSRMIPQRETIIVFRFDRRHMPRSLPIRDANTRKSHRPENLSPLLSIPPLIGLDRKNEFA